MKDIAALLVPGMWSWGASAPVWSVEPVAGETDTWVLRPTDHDRFLFGTDLWRLRKEGFVVVGNMKPWF